MNGTLNELPNMQYTYIYIYMQLDAAGRDLAYIDTLYETGPRKEDSLHFLQSHTYCVDIKAVREVRSKRGQSNILINIHRALRNYHALSLSARLVWTIGRRCFLEAGEVLFEFCNESLEVFQTRFRRVQAARFMLTIGNVNLARDLVQLA